MTLPKGSIYISVTQIKRRFQYGADSKMLYHSFEWGTCFPYKMDHPFICHQDVCASLSFSHSACARKGRKGASTVSPDGKEALSIMCEMLVIHW